ncbi:LLM class flavin-dependent oxidoreductase [Intrasporangium sp.]|uniref:LLM class flavin-dependent oxidoreductase n=1 Tax=Intrasporangium sp. TaxID=1925024 RepID=UPI00293AD647|nr:LLM class flavin-dependent oxidoreductase [Intrasporangium sp.]MDV3220978.1 LLM class flavin-dependent oxidoreductase [Intrasporangium sp.]
MDLGHPLEFGAFITPHNSWGPTADSGHTTGDPLAPVRLAQHSEAVGLDLVAFQDHPYQPRFHETWTLLSWVAGQTDRIRLAPSVINVPMRQPAVLAKAAASLDLLSHGRLQLALGAGHFWDAMESMGTRRLQPGESIDALEEAIDILRGVWAAGERNPLRTNGVHHRVDGVVRGPAPAHTLPIWVGGGKPRMLDLIGRLADGWVIPGGTVGLGDLSATGRAVDEAAIKAGRDPREIRRIANVSGSFDARRRGFLQGPATQWVEQLLPVVLDDGVGTVVLASDGPAAIETFAGEVVPALREAVAAERERRGTETRTITSTFVRVQRHVGIDYDSVPAPLAHGAVEPGDAAYARHRSTYLRGGSPGLVLRPRDVGEVAESVRWAGTQPVPLSVRSGGHGISGRSTNRGGIIIDLGRLREIEVLDPATRRVRIGPGARWGEVAAALAPRGWAITSGDYGGVGVGGLATAGGIGFLGRLQGLTIDRLRAVEMVLADGSMVRASESENRDLFWGVRGAGFLLGIVTSFEFEAGEVGDIGFGQLVHDVTSDVAGFLVRWGAAVEGSPRDTTSFLIMGPPRNGRVVAQTMNVVASDDAERILARLQVLAGVAPLIGQQAQIMPYAALVAAPPSAHDAQGQPVARSGLLDHVSPGFAKQAADLLHSGSVHFFQIRALGGATQDMTPDATAFAHRSARFSVVAMGASHSRLDRVWDALAHHFDGLYVSFDTDRRPERVGDAFPPATLERLRALKRTYDPGNVFRDNVQIEPTQP